MDIVTGHNTASTDLGSSDAVLCQFTHRNLQGTLFIGPDCFRHPPTFLSTSLAGNSPNLQFTGLQLTEFSKLSFSENILRDRVTRAVWGNIASGQVKYRRL